jgi:hypothetical protein
VTLQVLTPYGPVTAWCELGIGDQWAPSGQARWDVARWDDPEARWAGYEPIWSDVSCEVLEATTTRGRERITDRFVAGSSEVTFRNLDGWADLTWQHPPATLTLRPGRQIRWGVDTPTGRHTLFWGWIDEAIPAYAPGGRRDSTLVYCVDALGDAGRAELAAQDPPVHAGDTIDERIVRILDAVSWPPTRRDITPTAVTLLGSGYGQRALDELGQTADSGGGSVFGTTAGAVAYRPRDWQSYPPDAPPAGVVSNIDPDGVCPSGWELSYRRRDAAAEIRIGNTAGTVVTLVDQPTRDALGPEPFERLDLLANQSATLTTIAQRVAATHNLDTFPRVEAVSLDAGTDPGDGRVVELLAGVMPETASRLRVELEENGRRVFGPVDLLVTGITHSITGTRHWRARIALDVAAPFAADTARWDSARWDRSLWATAS